MVRTTGFRIQDSGFTRLLWNLIPALPLCCLLVAVIIKAQMPANTPTFSVNAKWVTDHGSQVYNVKAYGAKGDGVTDDSAAFAAALAGMPAGGGTLFIPPSSTPYVLSSARLAVLRSNVLVSGYGATLLCTVSDDCVTLGNLSNAIANNNIFVKGLTIQPGAGSAGHSAIRDNAQGIHIEDVTFSPNGSNGFGHLIENDNDQSQVLNKIFNVGSTLICNATSCGSAIWGPGPYSTNAGITFLSNFNFSMGCANGIDWQEANHLTVENGIIEAVGQYAIRAANGPNVTKIMVHEEPGGCTNPLGNVGIAGDIINGGVVTGSSLGPGGKPAQFVFTGTAGTAIQHYWIVAHGSPGVSVPLAVGYAINTSATIDASDTVAVHWNVIPTATSYDLLRQSFVEYSTRTAPYGTGNFAVATGLNPASVCSGGVCSFTDNVTNLGSYTVATTTGYFPYLPLWGADLVLSSASGSETNGHGGVYSGPSPGGGVVVNVCGENCYNAPNLIYDQGSGLDFSTNMVPFGPTLEMVVGGHVPNAPGLSALMMPSQEAYGTAGSNIKGVINLGGFVQGGGPLDLITLEDSNPAKTFSTSGHRPSWDPGDAAICQDTSNNAGLCFRAPSFISNYINQVPNASATNWQERLTSGAKLLSVPLGLGSGTSSIKAVKSVNPGIYGLSDVATGGTLSPNTQYCYRISATDALGVTIPPSEACITTANDGNSTHQVSVELGAVTGLTTGVNFYGRTTGAELFMYSLPLPTSYSRWYDTGAITPNGAMPTTDTTGQVQATLYSTTTNCSSSASPAVCGSAAAGSFVIAASTTSVVVDTTALTANSQILLTEDSSLGTKLSVTCNSQSLLTLGVPKVTARTAGTSFTASIEVGPTTNPMCVSYAIIN